MHSVNYYCSEKNGHFPQRCIFPSKGGEIWGCWKNMSQGSKNTIRNGYLVHCEYTVFNFQTQRIPFINMFLSRYLYYASLWTQGCEVKETFIQILNKAIKDLWIFRVHFSTRILGKNKHFLQTMNSHDSIPLSIIIKAHIKLHFPLTLLHHQFKDSISLIGNLYFLLYIYENIINKSC